MRAAAVVLRRCAARPLAAQPLAAGRPARATARPFSHRGHGNNAILSSHREHPFADPAHSHRPAPPLRSAQDIVMAWLDAADYSEPAPTASWPDVAVVAGFPDDASAAPPPLRWEAPPAAPPQPEIRAIKRTFQPSLIRRKRKHGFLVRLKDRNGRRILKRRRLKGRKQLAA